MHCSRCQADNRDAAVFCRECGARLEVVCPSCGARAEPQSRFCDACGAALDRPPAATPLRFDSPESYTPPHLARKILTLRSALEGERKQVTVLFVDVSGFTGMAEQLDPEDVHAVMTRAFERILAEVHRYEGTVNQFLGDGVMALFGAPIAHEDHARRAVHAALGVRAALESLDHELRRTRGLAFRVRQGLNTGLVVVGGIGSDLRMDYTAVGDTTNVASRLQQAAEPGRILISAATHALVEGYFYTRSLGALPVKGKSDPVEAWEVIAARVTRSRMEVEAERGLTPFVGRERELALLLEAFAKASAGHGQVVFLVGDAGIGKSRLLLEFRRRLGDATWLEGHALPFGRSSAFHPLIDLLKRNFRIEDGDDEAAIVGKIERGVLMLGEDLRPTLPFLRALLSVDPGDATVAAMDPRRRQAAAFDALRRLLVRAAEVRPQVCVYEDVHWMDQATEDMLRAMDEIVPSHRILHILAYRTGYAHGLGERSYHTRIGLDVLAPADSVEMACAMLGADRLPEALRSVVIDKAEGNPFFVEEIVKSLREVGALRRMGAEYVLTAPVDGGLLPGTIRDVIMARIDRLDEAPKRMLQLASVIGRDFTPRLVERLGVDIGAPIDEMLASLQATELVYQTSLFPEVAYTFRHALTHDVAYGSLLLQRRRELHRRIGAAIEELYADRLPEQYEVLAHHYQRGEDRAKALEYLLKAGDKAARAFANREALAFFEQALERLDADDRAPRADLLRRLATVTQYLGDADVSLHHAEQAVALYEALGDKRNAVAMHLHIDVLYSWQWDGAREDWGLKHVEAAAALVEDDPDSVEKGLVYQRTGHRYLHRCRPHTTVAWAQKAVDLFGRLGVAMGTSLGTALCYTGRLEDGVAYSEGKWEAVRKAAIPVVLAVFGHELTLALALARDVPRARRWGELVLAEVSSSSPVFEAMLRRPLALVYALSGEAAKAEETCAAVERIEAGSLLGCVYEDAGAVGLHHVQRGNREQGLRYLERLLPLYQERGNLAAVGACALFLGQLHLETGDAAAAAPHLERALAIAHEGGNVLLEAWARPVLARWHLARDDVAGATEHVKRGFALLAPGRAWSDLPSPLYLARAMVRTAERQWEDAGRDLKAAGALARQFELPWDEARVAQEWARMLRVRGGAGDAELARTKSDQAREILVRIGGAVQTDPTEARRGVSSV